MQRLTSFISSSSHLHILCGVSALQAKAENKMETKSKLNSEFMLWLAFMLWKPFRTKQIFSFQEENHADLNSFV